MTWLSPGNWWWLASLPVLVYLWRLAATRRRWQVPSLVPFEHLLARAARRRRRLVVNRLFWLQALLLVLLAAALAEPALERPRARTILAVVDTSASMSARLRGPAAFDRARRLLHGRLRRLGARDQVLLMTSAPVRPITPAPVPAAEAQAQLDALEVTHLAGNLGTAVQIGSALLEDAVDAMWVATDEPEPAVLPDRVTFLSVGAAMPNVAIVGLDAAGPLCAEAPARLGVTVENFWNEAADVEITVRHGRRELSKERVELARGQRRRLEVVLAEAPVGWVAVELRSRRDALAADNHALTTVRRANELPILLRSASAQTRRVLGEWLSACEGAVWSDATPAAPHVMITDDATAEMSPHAEGLLRLVSPEPGASVRLAHWMVEPDHPIASYLSPLEAVAAAWPAGTGEPAGEPVVWGLAGGRRVPLVVAGEEDGRKTVTFVVDPARSPLSAPLLVTFFNSLQWLASQSDVLRVGDALLVPSLAAGPVQVRRPDGGSEWFAHPGGRFRYDGTTISGRYVVRGGAATIERAVNALDPVESNLLARVSTWRAPPAAVHRGTARPATVPQTRRLLWLILALLLVEWFLSRVRRTV